MYEYASHWDNGIINVIIDVAQLNLCDILFIFCSI